MAILVDQNARVIVQGITGTQGRVHAEHMIEYGTEIVAGVTPGKEGQNVHGVPVFNNVSNALNYKKADASIIFVPAPFAKDAVMEAIENGLGLVVIITERIPVHDSMEFVATARKKGTVIIGPNSPGIISPEKCKLGIMPSSIFKLGRTGIVSRSGTLTYEVAYFLTQRNLGQSTCVGIGGDPILGSPFTSILRLFEEDDETDSVVLIGEIGGKAEQDAAEFIHRYLSKPMVGYIAGKCVPPGKRMGHAGAIIEGSSGTAESKIKILQEHGIPVATFPWEVPDLVEKEIKK